MSDRRALLQTDVVASTQLAERLGDVAMSALWLAHDRIARDLLRQWRGREIDKSDGFLLLFADVADAVAYALAYHRALTTLANPLTARAGVHVGPLIERATPGDDVARGAKPLEIDGLAKPIVARVMSLARGGQTLITAPARQALDAGNLRLRSHGHWRLQGVEEPIELFEVSDGGVPLEPPTDTNKCYRVVQRQALWVPLREVRHSLPAERNSFVGRRDALLELTRRFEDGARLVSVLGIGGAGKTRLAQRFGWESIGDHPGGVWFCDLSQARGLDGIVHSVAQGLEVPLGSGDPVLQIGHAIAGRGPCLVILDNFEQVSRHAEETVGRWLTWGAESRFIVTTREMLGIQGEQAMPLAPMALIEGAALFRERADPVHGSFEASDDDEVAIARLVQLLDGLPLAIELAASRVRVMSPRLLLQRMNERFKLLVSSRGRLDRHATLRAALDWSWDLLSDAEKSALAQLSVFEGGFTLDAVDAVLKTSPSDGALWPLDLVHALVDKSLVRRVEDDRFALLICVKEYADEKLGQGGGATRALAFARHVRYFADLDERFCAETGGIAELENLVIACQRATQADDAASATALLLRAWEALKLVGPFKVALELAAPIRGLRGLGDADRADVEWVAGGALEASGQGVSARDCLAIALRCARATGARRREALTLAALGEQHYSGGTEDEAQEHLALAREIADGLGDQRLQCRIRNALGALASRRGRVDEAGHHYEAALHMAQALRDRRWEGGLRGNLAILAHDAGRRDEALSEYEAALDLARQVRDRRWEGNTRCNLGLLHHECGRSADALSQFQRALDIARELGHPGLEATVLCNLGLVFEARGDLDDAAAHFESAVNVSRRLGDRRFEGQYLGYLGACRARRGQFLEAEADLGAAEALMGRLAERSSLGILFCQRADAAQLQGRPSEARAFVARAAALAKGEAKDSELARYLTQLNQRLASPDASESSWP